MRTFAFARRNCRELLRDPMTLAFGLGFPLALLFLLSRIERSVPVPLFEIRRLAPGVASFGLTFIALFSTMLLARDREQSFMARLHATPMEAKDFILGYLLPLLPLSAAQVAVCYLAAGLLGLPLGKNALISMLTLLPTAVLYIAIGLLCGVLLTGKQAGGVCGAALTNVCAWLGGVWFDLDLLGDGFRKAAELLPFAHAVSAARAAMLGDWNAMFPPLTVTAAYAAALLTLSVLIFREKMRRGTL